MAGVRSARAASGLRYARRWPWWAALVVAVVVLVAAGCVGGSVSGRSPAPRPFFPTRLTGCTPSGHLGECRTVWVPQDWAHPHGPQIPLLVAVLPATAAAHRAAPLFILAGWGGSAIGDVDWAVQAFGQLNQSMDLVFTAQRGTPLSWPQTCPGLEAARSPALRAAVGRCLASASRSPRHDTTAAAVRDLEQVRKALGYNKINLYGGSYGVTLGLAYVQRCGAHVRTAVFYSGSLLNVPLWQLTPGPRPAGLRPGGPPLRGRPGLRPVLPPGRRPGHRGQPPAHPPGPGHHHQPQRQEGDGHHHPARLPQRRHRLLPRLA
jgi:pimeloyl-ACP methyl ester carboxylesterase